MSESSNEQTLKINNNGGGGGGGSGGTSNSDLTKSTESISSSKSTGVKPSGIKPPSTIKIPNLQLPQSVQPQPPPLPLPPTSSTLSTTTTTTANVTSRIGRPCMAHAVPKTGPPPLPEQKNDTISEMRRQSDEYTRSHLPDVFEESEADLVKDKNNRSARSSKSKSPDVLLFAKPPRADRKVSNGSMGSDLYWEATGRRRSSDQGIILTVDTDSFIIGQRVWVGGVRPGHIAYIGETHFAPGDWAGIVLDDTSGKNDGCISGKRYFQCEPKRGIFSRLTRLTRDPLPGATISTNDISMTSSSNLLNSSIRSMISPTARSGTISPTYSMKSTSRSPTIKTNMAIGDRVIVSSGMGSRVGILQYLGETKFAPGTWCGVQLDEATGKNDGTIDGVKYFECPTNYGIFVPVAKVTLSPSARKPRLSRSGSKESLNSIGTLGSIASTATSRLRMSAQKLSSSTKSVTSPKNAFSLQDVLREKQNHIEQLLMERDLDRSDAESQLFQHQKIINQKKHDDADRWANLVRRRSARLAELRLEFQGWHGAHERHCILHDLNEKIRILEIQLDEEKRKAEDLQFTVDEVAICGDDLNIDKHNQNLIEAKQTQELLDRISQLETQLKDGGTINNITSSIITDSAINQSNQLDLENFRKDIERLKNELEERDKRLDQAVETEKKLNHEIAQLYSQQKEIETNQNIKIESLVVSEELLRNELQYLTKQNDELQTELRQKDEFKENEYLAMRHIENELREDILQLKSQLNEREKSQASSTADTENALKLANEEIVRYQEKISVLTEQNGKDLHEKNIEIENLKIKYDETMKRLVELNETINVSKTDIDNQLLIINNQKNIVDEKINQITVLETNAKIITEENELNKQLILEKNKNIENLDSEIKQLLDKQNKFLETSRSIEMQLVNFKEVQSTDQIRLDELSKQNESHRQEIANLINLKTELENDLLEKNQMQSNNELLINQLQLELKEIKSSEELNTLKNSTEINDLLEKIKKLTVEIEQKNQQSLAIEKQLNERVREIEEYENKYKILENQISTEISCKNENFEIINKLNLNIKQQHDEMTIEREKLTTLQSKINEMTTQINCLHIENDDQKKQIAERDLKITELNEESVKNREMHLILEVNYGDLERKMINIEQQREQMQQENESLQQNLAALQSTSTDQNNHYLKLSTELQEKLNENQRQLEKTMEIKLNFEKTIHELNQQLTLRNEQYERLKGEMNALDSQKTTMENQLNLELANYKETMEENEKQLRQHIELQKNEFTMEKTKLLNEISEKLQQSEVNRKELNSSITILEKSCKSLEAELQANKLDFEKKECELNEKLQEIYKIDEQLKLELEQTKQSQKTLQTALSEVNLEKEKNSENLHVQLAELQELKLSSNRIIETLQSDIRTSEEIHTKTINELQMENEQMKKDKLTNETELTASKHKCKEIEDELIDLVNKNEEYHKKILNLEELLQMITTDKEALNDALLLKEKEFSQFLIENDKEKLQLEESLKLTGNEQLDGFQKQIETLENTIKTVQSELNNRNLEFNAYKNEMENSVNAKDKVIELHNNKCSEIQSNFEVKISDLNKTIDNLNAELSKSSDQQKLKDSNILELKTHLNQLQKQITDKEREHLATMKNSITNENDKSLRSESAFKALKDEFNAFELKKLNEVETLTLKLWDLEEQMKNQMKWLEENEKLNEKQKDYLQQQKELVTKENELYSENKRLKEELILAKCNAEKEKILMQTSTTTTTSAKIPSDANLDSDSDAQISFLNSIIADMQRTNENLVKRIQTLESGPADFLKNGIFDMPTRRLPAPRLFCDICEEFDAHDTEDCPLQSSETSPKQSRAPSIPKEPNNTNASSTENSVKERKIPPPRKYCESCEEFGHNTDECEITF